MCNVLTIDLKNALSLIAHHLFGFSLGLPYFCLKHLNISQAQLTESNYSGSWYNVIVDYLIKYMLALTLPIFFRLFFIHLKLELLTQFQAPNDPFYFNT